MYLIGENDIYGWWTDLSSSVMIYVALLWALMYTQVHGDPLVTPPRRRCLILSKTTGATRNSYPIHHHMRPLA